MTREELIEMLNILLDNAEIVCADITVIKHVSFDSFKFVLVQAIKALEQEPKTGHWIPVSERLPKAGEYIGDVERYYLVQNEYGDMLVARYTHSGYWEQIYQLKPIGDEIVAWMPLPEPYKAESEDNT